MNLKQKLIRLKRLNVPSKLRNWTVANLIDDIHWQYTQWVMGLECSRGTFFHCNDWKFRKCIIWDFRPNFLKVHFVTLGKTLAMGSTLSSGSSCIMLATCVRANIVPEQQRSAKEHPSFNSKNLNAISSELSSQEDVHEVDVAEDVEEVDGLGDQHLERPDVVAAQVFHEVACKHLFIL